MADAVVSKVWVEAQLDHEEASLEEARRHAEAGDESWREWVEELERGDALVLKVRTTLEANAGGRTERIDIVNPTVWVENDTHPPVIAEQVRVAAGKDVGPLVRELAARGIELDPGTLERMFFDVELHDDVRRALRRRSRGGPQMSPAVGPTE